MSKKQLLCKITPRSPLLLGDRTSNGNFRETEDFIPGRTLRGAIAGRLLEACSRPEHLDDHAACPERESCAFWQVFGVADAVNFGNAYPGDFGPVWPFPLTTHTCKRRPGLVGPTTDGYERAHGIRDNLFADLAYGMVSDVDYPARSFLQSRLHQAGAVLWGVKVQQARHTCPAREGSAACAAQMVPVQGYYAWREGVARVELPTVARTTHVGINRARAVAEDEILFTQETLAAHEGGQSFFALVRFDESRETAVRATMTGEYYVGRGRSRGLGRVYLTEEVASSYPLLESRLHRFQTQLSRALLPYAEQDHRVQWEIPGRVFSLTLRAPAVLRAGARPLRVPTPEMLALPRETRVLHAWARCDYTGGWHGAAGLPRTTHLVTRAGSVFVYYVPENVLDEALLLEKLATLESEGIGAMREAGYGQVTVCAAIHGVDTMA